MALAPLSGAHERSTFETLDDGFHLLRHLPASAWAIYFTGTVPFLLALLWTATEITVLYSPVKGLRNALLCAVAFLWMQFWKARFAEALEQQLQATVPQPWSAARVVRCVCLQAAFHSAKLVLLPAAAVTLLPWVWMVSFFRNCTVLVSRPVMSLSELMRKAAGLAYPDARRSWLLFALFLTIGIFVFLNIGLLLLILPSLVKTLSGYENQFTRGTGNPLNWRTVQTTGGFTWLAMDPLVQAVAVVRIFSIEATTNGADLLQSFRTMAIRAALVFFALSFTLPIARADVPPLVLQQKIEQVLQREQYSWREQTKEEPNAKLGPLAKLAQAVRQGFRKLGAAIETVIEWFRRAFETNDPGDSSDAAGTKKPSSVRWTVGTLAAVIGIALVVFFFRRPPEEPVPAAPAAAAAIDLADESVGAAALPEDGWLSMAQQCVERQEYRLALRALYLATLAHLGERQLLTLQSNKSNRDYQHELRRRSSNDRLQHHFRESVQRFEAAWYGTHRTGDAQVSEYRLTFDAVRADAE